MVARCREESKPPKSVIRVAHLACESATASSSDATVDSKFKREFSPIQFGDEVLSLSGEKILSMPSVPANSLNQ